MTKKIFLLYLFFNLIFLNACSDAELSKEDQIRQLIDIGVRAAENRDHGDLAEIFANDYADDKGLTKTQLINKVRAYFFLHKNIHLFTKLDEITIKNEKRANVKIYVAMTASAAANASVLSGLSATIYLFNLEFVLADEWQLNKANWETSSFKDMMNIKPTEKGYR